MTYYSRAYGPLLDLTSDIPAIDYRRPRPALVKCFDCLESLPPTRMLRLPSGTVLFCADCYRKRTSRAMRRCIDCERQLPYEAFWRHGEFSAHVCAQCREG